MSFLAQVSIILLLFSSTHAHCPELYQKGNNWASAHCIYANVKCDPAIATRSGSCKSNNVSEVQPLKCIRSACAYCHCNEKLTLCDSTVFYNLCVDGKPVPSPKPRNLWRPNRSGWHTNIDAWNANVSRISFPNKTWVSIPGNDVPEAGTPWSRVKANNRCWAWNLTDVTKGPWPSKPICYFFRVLGTGRYKFSVFVPSREIPEIRGVHTFAPKLRLIFYNAVNDVIGTRNFDGRIQVSPLLLAAGLNKVCVYPSRFSFSFCGLYFWRYEYNESTILQFGIKEPVPTTQPGL